MIAFNNPLNCIDTIRKATNFYPKLNEIILESDYKKWLNKLNNQNDFESFLFGDGKNLNILNILSYAGLKLDNANSCMPFDHADIILTKLSKYLNKFPELIQDKNFKSKLINLEGLFFLSTLSELTLAYALEILGFKIHFEKKFKQLTSNKKRDIDIVISDKNGNNINIEIYMPVKQLEVSGFFDPYMDDKIAKTKIQNKILTKFGEDDVSGLSGQIFLGVNLAFIDRINFKFENEFFNNESFYNQFSEEFPKEVDGLIFFEDSFSDIDSFRFWKIILKPKF